MATSSPTKMANQPLNTQPFPPPLVNKLLNMITLPPALSFEEQLALLTTIQDSFINDCSTADFASFSKDYRSIFAAVNADFIELSHAPFQVFWSYLQYDTSIIKALHVAISTLPAYIKSIQTANKYSLLFNINGDKGTSTIPTTTTTQPTNAVYHTYDKSTTLTNYFDLFYGGNPNSQNSSQNSPLLPHISDTFLSNDIILLIESIYIHVLYIILRISTPHDNIIDISTNILQFYSTPSNTTKLDAITNLSPTNPFTKYHRERAEVSSLQSTHMIHSIDKQKHQELLLKTGFFMIPTNLLDITTFSMTNNSAKSDVNNCKNGFILLNILNLYIVLSENCTNNNIHVNNIKSNKNNHQYYHKTIQLILLRLLSYNFLQQQFRFLFFHLIHQLHHNEALLFANHTNIAEKITIYSNDIIPLLSDPSGIHALSTMLTECGSTESSLSIEQNGDNIYFLSDAEYSTIITYLSYTYSAVYILLHLFAMIPPPVMYTTLFLEYHGPLMGTKETIFQKIANLTSSTTLSRFNTLFVSRHTTASCSTSLNMHEFFSLQHQQHFSTEPSSCGQINILAILIRLFDHTIPTLQYVLHMDTMLTLLSQELMFLSETVDSGVDTMASVVATTTSAPNTGIIIDFLKDSILSTLLTSLPSIPPKLSQNIINHVENNVINTTLTQFSLNIATNNILFQKLCYNISYLTFLFYNITILTPLGLQLPYNLYCTHFCLYDPAKKNQNITSQQKTSPTDITALYSPPGIKFITQEQIFNQHAATQPDQSHQSLQCLENQQIVQYQSIFLFFYTICMFITPQINVLSVNDDMDLETIQTQDKTEAFKQLYSNYITNEFIIPGKLLYYLPQLTFVFDMIKKTHKVCFFNPQNGGKRPILPANIPLSTQTIVFYIQTMLSAFTGRAKAATDSSITTEISQDFDFQQNIMQLIDLTRFAHLLQFFIHAKVETFHDIISLVSKHINFYELAIFLHNNNESYVSYINTLIFKYDPAAVAMKNAKMLEETQITLEKDEDSTLETTLRPKNKLWSGVSVDTKVSSTNQYQYNQNLSEEENFKNFLKQTGRTAKAPKTRKDSRPVETRLRPLTEEEKEAIKNQYNFINSNIYNDEYDDSLDNITTSLTKDIGNADVTIKDVIAAESGDHAAANIVEASDISSNVKKAFDKTGKGDQKKGYDSKSTKSGDKKGLKQQDCQKDGNKPQKQNINQNRQAYLPHEDSQSSNDTKITAKDLHAYGYGNDGKGKQQRPRDGTDRNKQNEGKDDPTKDSGSHKTSRKETHNTEKGVKLTEKPEKVKFESKPKDGIKDQRNSKRKFQEF